MGEEAVEPVHAESCMWGVQLATQVFKGPACLGEKSGCPPWATGRTQWELAFTAQLVGVR